MKTIWKDIQKHLLSGVSFMMPVVVAGGAIRQFPYWVQRRRKQDLFLMGRC